MLLALGAPAAGQTQYPFHVSTTSPVTLGSTVHDDSSLVSCDAQGGVTPFFNEGHWQGTIGFVPGDLDAFGRRPGTANGSADSMVFSFLSNHAGFLDGDVLGFAPGGGLEVVVSEADILSSLGVPAARIDVDALDFPVANFLYYSLQSDLSGTNIGDVSDGDVLIMDLSLGVSFLFKSEADVQESFFLATGNSAPIIDVQALHCYGSDLWIVPQSPSDYDGAIISCLPVPLVVRDEASMGLGGAEINAISMIRPGDDIGRIGMDRLQAMPGETVQLTLHGEPNTVYAALFSGRVGYNCFRRNPGFGVWYQDPSDPWLISVLTMMSPPTAVTDNQGLFTAPWTFPASPFSGLGFGNEEGWTFQMLALPNLELSAPYRVTKL